MRPRESVSGLSDWIEHLRPAMTEPTFARLHLLVLAWLVAPAPQLITTALVMSGLSTRHHAAFYRLFSKAKWQPDELGRWLVFALLDAFVDPAASVNLIMDDTLTHHKGPKTEAIGCHIDPVRSSRSYKVKAFGHVWVIAALRLKFRFSARFFALPIAFRLYRTQAACEASGEVFRKKTELAREMMEMIAGWLPNRQIVLCVDNAYFCAELLKNRPDNVEIIGHLKSNVRLRTETPLHPKGAAHRPRRQGNLLPKMTEIFEDDENYRWQDAVVSMYRDQREVDYKSFSGQWYGSNGRELMAVVMVKMERGDDTFRIYASTNKERVATEVIAEYAGRWAIEPTNRELKQELGFGASAVRNPNSVARLPVMVGLVYSVVVAWYAQHGCGSEHDWMPHRPWYTTKKTPSFTDMVEAAKHAIRAAGLFHEVDHTDFPRNLSPPWHKQIRRAQDGAHPTEPPITPEPVKIAA